MALHLALLDLKIRDCGVQHAVPIDQTLVLVDQPLLMEIDEYFAHGVGQALVHGEAIA